MVATFYWGNSDIRNSVSGSYLLEFFYPHFSPDPFSVRKQHGSGPGQHMGMPVRCQFLATGFIDVLRCGKPVLLILPQGSFYQRTVIYVTGVHQSKLPYEFPVVFPIPLQMQRRIPVMILMSVVPMRSSSRCIYSGLSIRFMTSLPKMK